MRETDASRHARKKSETRREAHRAAARRATRDDRANPAHLCNARDSTRRLQRDTTFRARRSTVARPRHLRNAAARRLVFETRRNAACAPAKAETRWTCAARQREKLACTKDVASHSVVFDSSKDDFISSASSSASRRERSTSSAQSWKARANAARLMRCRHRVTFTLSRLSFLAASRQRLKERNCAR